MLEETALARSLVGKYVDTYAFPDGRFEVRWKGLPLAYAMFDKDRRRGPAPRTATAVQAAPCTPAQKPRRPIRPRHPRPPFEVGARQAVGHRECDLMIFRREHGPANVTSPIERRTRYAVLLKNTDRRSKPLMNRQTDLFSPLPAPARQSMTFDRGFEFTSWRDLETGMCHRAWPSWQKGLVENLNRRVRRDLPSDTPTATISHRSMMSICDRPSGSNLIHE